MIIPILLDNHELGFLSVCPSENNQAFWIESNQIPKYFMEKDWDMGDEEDKKEDQL